jgi:hypothetical protein
MRSRLPTPRGCSEIELKQETQELILPPWIGKEVTGDSFYKKINMRDRALKARHESCASTPCRHRDGGQRDISAGGDFPRNYRNRPPEGPAGRVVVHSPARGGSPYPLPIQQHCFRRDKPREEFRR